MENTKQNKRLVRRIVIAFVIVIIPLVVAIIIVSMKKSQKTFVSHDGSINPNDDIEEVPEEVYVEFEELFSPMQDDMQMIVDELNHNSFLKDKEYYIVFDSELPSGNPLQKTIEIAYNDRLFFSEDYVEIADSLNENEVLVDLLDEMQDKGIIFDIGANYWEEQMLVIEFAVDPEYKSFSINNNIINSFGYCTNEECEKYGLRKIEGNWYMYIPPRPG